MWILPTRGRPELCQNTLDACRDTGMTSRGILYIDETRPGEYDGIVAADNWTIIVQRLDMADTMRDAFLSYPDERSYGWISDDLIPQTPCWDAELEVSAGNWCLADCQDLYLAKNGRVQALTGAFCWGGELVRTVGWWALPDVRQAGVDDAWSVLLRYLNLRRFRPDVIVEHLNWRTGKRPKDGTDSWSRDGEDYVEKDMEICGAWIDSDDFRETFRRVAIGSRAAEVI